MSNGMQRCYSECIKLPSFSERLEYLQLSGNVGEDTFGSKRYLNQAFYRSKEWRDFRNKIIIRDSGCDLGIEGMDIPDGIIIHHLNPITATDVLNRSSRLFDLENVICVSGRTHRQIHYGFSDKPNNVCFMERTAHDTCPWKK